MVEFTKNKIKGLEYINSPYIIKEIFSFLDEKQKLNMIIYNKHLKNIYGVDIQTYKKISGKYKIGEKNGFAKEYILYKNKLIFQGEYLNGKKHGKGEEYYESGKYSNKLKFEGEYLNGQRHGKGKEYYKNEGLLFEGEYKSGKNGMGQDLIILVILNLYLRMEKEREKNIMIMEN